MASIFFRFRAKFSDTYVWILAPKSNVSCTKFWCQKSTKIIWEGTLYKGRENYQVIFCTFLTESMDGWWINVLRKIDNLLQAPCADVSDGTVNYSWVRFMILDSLGCLLGLGSHSLIALSMHDRFWYRCLGDATHLLLSISVGTLGQKVRLNSHSVAAVCVLVWSGILVLTHILHSLSMDDSFWYRCLGDATHLIFGISVCTLGQKVRLNSHCLVNCFFPCLI